MYPSKEPDLLTAECQLAFLQCSALGGRAHAHSHVLIGSLYVTDRRLRDPFGNLTDRSSVVDLTVILFPQLEWHPKTSCSLPKN